MRTVRMQGGEERHPRGGYLEDAVLSLILGKLPKGKLIPASLRVSEASGADTKV